MLRRHYIKYLESFERFKFETDGYTFFAKYYDNVPQLLRTCTEKVAFEVWYEHLLTDGRSLVGSHIADGKNVDIRHVFRTLADITNEQKAQRFSGGGTQTYYYGRLHRLADQSLTADYLSFVKTHPVVYLEKMAVVMDSSLLQRINNDIASLRYGWCAPSHGDLHELNIFSDGHLIDFEGSGWNHIATDIATFIWHTLFVGNHFGPRYAKWTRDEDKQSLNYQKPQFTYNEGVVQISIAPSRMDLINQFREEYMTQVDVIDAEVEYQIASAVAFRLLSVFEVSEMDTADKLLAYTLANYFADDSTSLHKKLEVFGIVDIVNV